jgi:hypothetical protein
MSRIEATIPEPRLEQVKHLEEELGLTKSQIVEEAIGLFFKAVLEVRQGHRVGFMAEDRKSLVVEFTSPALSQVEWATHRETVHLSDRGFDRMQKLIENPPAPVPALKAAMARRKKR